MVFSQKKNRTFAFSIENNLPTMSHKELSAQLSSAVDALSCPQALRGLFHQHREGCPLPSGDALAEVEGLCRAILFPGYFGRSQVNLHTIRYQLGVSVERLFALLTEQLWAGLCFSLPEEATPADVAARRDEARQKAALLIQRLPHIRQLLSTDVAAAYEGDPAAESVAEILSCYPVIKTLTNYRVAHELYTMGVPLIPRMLTERAHSETGMDIHPGAEIGEHFTIDHGTGVVIGATTIIGRNVKLYQGVTLGARSFPLDENGHPIKGQPRHPILEDDVVVYANATVLGRITIGRGCVVGANTWVMEDMAPQTRKYHQPCPPNK